MLELRLPARSGAVCFLILAGAPAVSFSGDLATLSKRGNLEVLARGSIIQALAAHL